MKYLHGILPQSLLWPVQSNNSLSSVGQLYSVIKGKKIFPRENVGQWALSTWNNKLGGEGDVVRGKTLVSVAQKEVFLTQKQST